VCVQCPDNTLFDSPSGQCIMNINNGTTATCPINATLNPITQQCVCPPSLPYTDGYICLNCFAPYFWNQATRSCTPCQDGTVWNQLSMSCTPCPSNTPL
jgi:hypothetical protein